MRQHLLLQLGDGSTKPVKVAKEEVLHLANLIEGAYRVVREKGSMLKESDLGTSVMFGIELEFARRIVRVLVDGALSRKKVKCEDLYRDDIGYVPYGEWDKVRDVRVERGVLTELAGIAGWLRRLTRSVKVRRLLGKVEEIVSGILDGGCAPRRATQTKS